MSGGVLAAISDPEGDVTPGSTTAGFSPQQGQGVVDGLWKGVGVVRQGVPCTQCPGSLGSSEKQLGIHFPAALDPYYSIANLKLNKGDFALSLRSVSIPREGN